jgi:hypothetical protein
MERKEGEGPTASDLLGVVERLRAERSQATGDELDQVKRRAMIQAARAHSPRTPRMGNGAIMTSRRVISIALAIALMMGGTAVFATSGGPKSASSGKNGSAAKHQYCSDHDDKRKGRDDDKDKSSKGRDDDDKGKDKSKATARSSKSSQVKKPGPSKCDKDDDDDDDDTGKKKGKKKSKGKAKGDDD